MKETVFNAGNLFEHIPVQPALGKKRLGGRGAVAGQDHLWKSLPIPIHSMILSDTAQVSRETKDELAQTPISECKHFHFMNCLMAFYNNFLNWTLCYLVKLVQTIM